MNESLRKLKFENMIKDINTVCHMMKMKLFGGSMSKAIMNSFNVNESSNNICRNNSMRIIFNYEKANEYARIIMQNSWLRLSEWDQKYSKLDLADENNKIMAAKDLVRYCRLDENRKEAYKFIFWALLITTVDETDADTVNSLICDFAAMLKITEDEVFDIIQIIKAIYREEKDDFKSKTIPDYFSEVLRMYE